MADYSDWESFLNAMEKDVDIAFEKVSEILVDIWQREVEDKFYGSYTPVEYVRNFQTLESIRKIDVSKSYNGQIEIEIGYDTSMISTSEYVGAKTGVRRERHSEPDMQPFYVEYGFEGFGVEREGANAFEYMLKYVQSDDFRALISNELRKLGYKLK